MSRQSTINAAGRWYKGNTHAHTNISDAVLPPDKLVGIYKALGYDFTAITDHRIYGIHAELTTADFLVLPGVELDVRPSAAEGLAHHVVGLGLPGINHLAHGQRIEYPADASVSQIIDLLTSLGHLCIYAHPGWSHTRHESLDQLQGFSGLEIYNHACEVGSACGLSESHYDRLLWQGRKFWCVASDDTHQQRVDYGGGFIMVKAPELTQAAIIQALLAGSFYASQGPLIEDYYREGDQVHIRCSPSRLIGFQNDINAGFALNDDAARLTEGVYALRGTESYVRALCIDAAGNRAWTQPIWLA